MKISLKRRESGRDGVFLRSLLSSAAVVSFLAFFFYRSLWAVFPLTGAGVWWFRNFRQKDERKKKQETAAQFRECILSVATLLQAGHSAENAFEECGRDMRLLFGEKARISAELRQLQRGLRINISLEELLMDMAVRTDCEEILQFARVFGLAKRSGGSMPEIIRNTAELIGKQIELRQEIQTLLSGKRLELTIMRVMPFAILFYIEAANPGYFQVLYHNLKGCLIMTGCLLAYLGAYLLGERILNRLWEELT